MHHAWLPSQTGNPGRHEVAALTQSSPNTFSLPVPPEGGGSVSCLDV